MSLEDVIKSCGIKAEIIKFDSPTSTSREAREVVDGQIAKSIVLVGKEPLLVILRGEDKINMKKFFGYRLAKREEVKEISGYDVGEVPPIGTKIKNVVVDEKLKGVVYCGGGTKNTLLRISVDDIVKCTNARVDKIAISS